MVFGLFKKKLNIRDNSNTINYLILEEANQQWIFHAVENNFSKDHFRGAPFSKQVISSFVEFSLEKKVDNQMLDQIVNLGYRKCKEWLNDYNFLKSKVADLEKKELLSFVAAHTLWMDCYMDGSRQPFGIYSPDMIMSFRYLDDHIRENYIRQNYKGHNLFYQIARDGMCHIQYLNDIVGEELDKLLDNAIVSLNKQKDDVKDGLFLSIEDVAIDFYNHRNLNNEFNQNWS